MKAIMSILLSVIALVIGTWVCRLIWPPDDVKPIIGPPVPHVTSGSNDSAKIEGFVASRFSAEGTHDLNRILGFYEQKVDFWENGLIDREQIRGMKTAYWITWPKTHESLVPPVQILANDGTTIVTKCNVDFKAENPAKGKVSQGSEWYTLSLHRAGNSFRIFDEKGGRTR